MATRKKTASKKRVTKKKTATKKRPAAKKTAKKKAVARKSGKGAVVAAKVVNRKPGFLYYVDGNGNVRETKMKRGGTKGHRTCK